MKYFLSLLNYIESKKHRVNRKSINYKKSLSIAIVYYYESEIKQKFVNKFLNNLKKDNKNIDLYPIIEFTNAENRYLYTFKTKDLNFWGKWKSNNANNLIYQPYDYLIYIDLNLNEEIKNILIRSLAKCRIGFKNEKKLFDLIIKSKNEFDFECRLDELVKYLKMIK